MVPSRCCKKQQLLISTFNDKRLTQSLFYYPGVEGRFLGRGFTLSSGGAEEGSSAADKVYRREHVLLSMSGVGVR